MSSVFLSFRVVRLSVWHQLDHQAWLKSDVHETGPSPSTEKSTGLAAAFDLLVGPREDDVDV